MLSAGRKIWRKQMAFSIKFGSIEEAETYRIWPNYSTYPYKHTVKQVRSLQIIQQVYFLATSL